MSPDLSTALCRDFPKLFQDGACGFPGDGWEPLLRELAVKLQWLSDVLAVQAVAVQVKEKYGTLRFYFETEVSTDGEWPPMVSLLYDAVSAAEHRSAHTCEVCGDFGRLRHGGWLKTLCARHAYEARRPISSYEAETIQVIDHVQEPED